MSPKILIGLISFNDLHYMKHLAPILDEMRKVLPATIAVIDTAHNDEVRDFFQKDYPELNYFRHPDGNIGYGRSNNEILRAFPGHDYFICCTNDVLLNIKTVQNVLVEMEKNKKITMACGKLYHWDYEKNSRTNIIDSFGIMAEKRHHFYDRGQGEKDEGQYDATLQNIFGISGATFIIRTSVIHKLHSENWRLFDESMWMYKEDIDLSYRLRLLGEKIWMSNEVWAWHARTVTSSGANNMKSLVLAQKTKAGYARSHSYKNHFLLLKNHVRWDYGVSVLAKIFFYELCKAVFMLCKYPKVFFGGMRTLLFTKGKTCARLVSSKSLLSDFFVK